MYKHHFVFTVIIIYLCLAYIHRIRHPRKYRRYCCWNYVVPNRRFYYFQS